MPRGGKRKNAGRIIKGWQGVEKGKGTKGSRFPVALVDKLQQLRDSEANLPYVLTVLEFAHNQTFEVKTELTELRKLWLDAVAEIEEQQSVYAQEKTQLVHQYESHIQALEWEIEEIQAELNTLKKNQFASTNSSPK